MGDNFEICLVEEWPDAEAWFVVMDDSDEGYVVGHEKEYSAQTMVREHHGNN